MTARELKLLLSSLLSPNRYGCLSKASDEFVFYPEWFLEPLQTALDFQTGVAQTQMFVDFVHKVTLFDHIISIHTVQYVMHSY
jgi:hypothetical protein